LIDGEFIGSVDSRVIFGCTCDAITLLFGSSIEVIGANAFRLRKLSTVLFESGMRLREIFSRAFSFCRDLTAFKVPESVEILGDHCFENCLNLERIDFEGSSSLKRICELAFHGCNLHSITIPASTEEIDGSAFVNCPFISIQIGRGSDNFKVEDNLLVTSGGTDIVRYFGQDRELHIGNKVHILRKSCFQGCDSLEKIDF
jgi:hypothetical protein